MGALERARPTGRCVRGAIADQVELADGDARYTALVYADDYRDDPALAAVAASPGLVARGAGVFVYRATGRTARELAVVLAEDGGAGVRAALQLLVRAAKALDGQRHGNLSAWHVLVSPMGEVQLVGGGLPAIDVNDFIGDEELVPSNRTLRYCPPERLEGAEEDHTADLYSLALIAAEVACGMPVYPGKRAQVLDAAAAGDAGQLVRELELPDDFVDLLRAMLAPYAEDRAPAQLWLETAKAMAAESTGPDLAQAVVTAAEFLSVDEVELPEPFALPPLEAVDAVSSQEPPEEPQAPEPAPEPVVEAAVVPQPAPQPAAPDGPAQRARTSADALAGLLLAARLAVDEAIPPVAEALERAEAELAQAEAAAERADAAADDEGAEQAAVDAAAHLLTGEQLIDAIVEAQDAWLAHQVDDARRRIRAVVALTVTADRSDLEASAKAFLKHSDLQDPQLAGAVANEAEALVEPLLAERAAQDSALAASLREAAESLEQPEQLDRIDQALLASFAERRAQLAAIEAALDAQREERVEAARGSIEQVAAQLRELGESVEAPPPGDDLQALEALEALLRELQHRAVEANDAAMAAAIARAEEALASVASLERPADAVQAQVDAARDAAGLSDAVAAAEAAEAAAAALHAEVQAERLAQALADLGDVSIQAQALGLEVPEPPDDADAVEQLAAGLRVAIREERAARLAALTAELAQLAERAAPHGIEVPQPDAEDLDAFVAATTALARAVEAAEEQLANQLAAQRAELVGALAAQGLDETLPTDDRQAITVAEERLARHAAEQLDQARTRWEAARTALIATGDDERIRAGEAAPDDEDPATLHAAAEALEALIVEAQAAALERAQQRFAKVAAEAEELGLPIPEAPGDEATLLEVSKELAQATQAAASRLLEDAVTAADAAWATISQHGDAMQQQLAAAARDQVHAATDHHEAQEALGGLAELAAQVGEERAERARAAFTVAAAEAASLGVEAPEAPPQAVDDLEAATRLLSEANEAARHGRRSAAIQRIEAAWAALGRIGDDLPDDLEALEAEAAAAETAVEAARAAQLAEALTELAGHRDAAAVLDVDVPSVDEDDLDAVLAAAAQAAERVEHARQQRRSEALTMWAGLEERAELLGLNLGSPGDEHEVIEAACERARARLEEVEAVRRDAAAQRVADASERLDAPSPELPADLAVLEALADDLESKADAHEADEARRASEALAAARLAYEEASGEALALGLEPPPPPGDTAGLHSATAELELATKERRRQLTAEAGAQLRELVLQLRALDVSTDAVQRPVGATLEQLQALVRRAQEALGDAQADRHESAVALWDAARARAAAFGVAPLPPDGSDAAALQAAAESTQQAVAAHLEQRMSELRGRAAKAQDYLRQHAPARPGEVPEMGEQPSPEALEALERSVVAEEEAVVAAQSEALADALATLDEAQARAGVAAPPHDPSDIAAVTEALEQLLLSHPPARLDSARAEWLARRSEAEHLGIAEIEVPEESIAGYEEAIEAIDLQIASALHADAVERREPLLALAARLNLPVGELSTDGVQAQREVDALASAIDTTWRAVNVERHQQLTEAAASHGVALALPDPDGSPAAVADALDHAEADLARGRREQAIAELAQLQADADARDLGLQFAVAGDATDDLSDAIASARAALLEARLDAARAEAGAAADRARSADLAPHTAQAEAASETAHSTDDPQLAEQAAADALAAAKAAEAVRIEEAIQSTQEALARARATGDPVGIEDATRALAAVQSAATLAQARAAEANARQAAARGAAPDLDQRRQELLAQLDAESPRLAALKQLVDEVPEPTGPESRDVRDALLRADPTAAFDTLRGVIIDAGQQTELLHATQGLRDALARLQRAEDEMPALARDAWLAMIVDDVAAQWAVCHEASDAEGGEAPLRAADRALRTARAARARDDEGALQRAQRAAHDAADRARAVLAAEAERERRGDLEDDDSVLLEEITESTRAMADEARRVVDMLDEAAPQESARARTTAERVSEQSLVGTLTMDVSEAAAARDKAAEAYRQLRRIASAHGVEATNFDASDPAQSPPPTDDALDEDARITEQPPPPPSPPVVSQRPSRFTFEEPALRQHPEFVDDEADDFHFPIDDDPSEDSRPRPAGRVDVDATMRMEPMPLEPPGEHAATVPFDDWADEEDPATAALVPEEDTDPGPTPPVPDASWSPFELEAEDDDALFADHGPPTAPDPAEDSLATHAIEVIDLAPDLLGPGGDVPDTDVFDDPAEIFAAAEAEAFVAPPAPPELLDEDDDEEEEARTIQMRMPADLAELIRDAAGDRPEPAAADPQATVLFQRPTPDPEPAAFVDDDEEEDGDAGEDEPTRRLSVASLRERLLRRKREQEARKTPPPPPDDYDPHAQTLLLTPDALAAMVQEASDDDDDDDSDEGEAKTTLFYRPGYDD